MLVLVTYNVATTTREGRKRLSRAAEACLDYGQRVQNSVFECQIDPTQWSTLKLRLLDLYNPNQDSLRFHYLGANWHRRVEHHGTKPATDLKGPLIVWPERQIANRNRAPSPRDFRGRAKLLFDK